MITYFCICQCSVSSGGPLFFFHIVSQPFTACAQAPTTNRTHSAHAIRRRGLAGTSQTALSWTPMPRTSLTASRPSARLTSSACEWKVSNTPLHSCKPPAPSSFSSLSRLFLSSIVLLLPGYELSLRLMHVECPYHATPAVELPPSLPMFQPLSGQ